ncbi:hypothetical protein ACJ41O_014857 [Fusarium nematophilum]
MDLAYQWYTECVNSHEKCNTLPIPKPGWTPTRLIDIGGSEWHLRIGAEDLASGPVPPYMTLSYRWGAEPRILLLSSNMDAFRRGMPFAGLPQTFRDFVEVARRFRVRFIWIDSLCIIQDSIQDWESEAPKMRDVYCGSVCNVAASACSDPESGMFRSRNAADVRPGLVEASITLSGGPQRYRIFDKSYWQRHLSDGSLHSRAWVFQETYLAPRVLYLAGRQILWECLTEHKCEGFPLGIPLHESPKKIDSLLATTQTPSSSGNMSYESVNLWIDMVASYSRCELTRSEDKLWAFSGIAKLFQETSGGEYLAGLWKSRLLELLDWRVYEPKARLSSAYRAPSWSWASIDGPVKPKRPHNRYNHVVEVLEAKAEPRGGDALGGISDAFLRLKGPVVMAKRLDQEASCRLEIGSGSNPVITHAFPDTTDTQLGTEGPVTVLLFKSQQVFFADAGETWEMMCLTLAAVGGAKNCFRRTGHLVLRNNFALDRNDTIERVRNEAKVQEMTIV